MQGFEDPLNRGTYPWGREDPALLAYFRQLGALRKQRVSLQCGDIGYLYAVGGGLVLRRQSEDEVTVAAMNAGMQPLELSIPWSGALAKDALTGQQFFARNGMLRLTLPPRGRRSAGVIVHVKQLPGTSALEKRGVSRETSLFCKVCSFPIEKNCDS